MLFWRAHRPALECIANQLNFWALETLSTAKSSRLGKYGTKSLPTLHEPIHCEIAIDLRANKSFLFPFFNNLFWTKIRYTKDDHLLFNVYETVGVFNTRLHRLWLPSGLPKRSRMIRFINVVDVMFRPFPEFRDHFIEKPGLRWIDEDMLTQSTFAIRLFSVHFLMTSAPSANPSAPMQTIEFFWNNFHWFTFARSQRKLRYRSDRLEGVQCVGWIGNLQVLQTNCQTIDGWTRRWG